MSAGIGGINVDGAGAGGAAGAITNINISAGAASNNLSAVTFANSNGVSFGINASTVTASHAVNVSAGTTSNNLSAITFSNSLGFNFGINASTLTAGPAPLSNWRNYDGGVTTNNNAIVNTQASIAPFILSSPVVFSYLWVPAQITRASAANTSSAYLDLSITAVIYTRNVSTLSYLTSISNTMTSVWRSNSYPFSAANGFAPISMSNAAATTLTQGEYFIAFHISTTNSATNASTATTALTNQIYPMLFASAGNTANANLAPWGSTVEASTVGYIGGAGVLSSAATRSSIAFSDYSCHGARGFSGMIAFEVLNQTWQNFS